MGRRSVAQRWLPGVGDSGVGSRGMTRGSAGEEGEAVFQGQHE